MGSDSGATRRAAGLLLALTSLAILMGYLREVAIAATFGAGRVTDAYFVVLALVAALTDLIPGAALLTSLVPVLAPLAAKADTAAIRRTIVTIMACILAGTTVFLAAVISDLAPAVVALIAPGFDAATSQSAIVLAGGLAWLLPLQAMLLLFTLALNAHGHFLLAASMPSISNAIFAAILVVLGATHGEYTLLIAALAGPAVAVSILAVQLVRMRLLGFGGTADAGAALRRIWRLARPTLLTVGIGSGTGLLMASHLLLRRYGSQFGPGSVSALNYAFRIYEVPVSLVANVAATLALPAIATLHDQALGGEILRQCRNILVWEFILLLPASLIAFAEAPFLVDFLFRHGRFSGADAALTSDALRGFAPAILFEAGFVVFYRVFYAIHRPLIPVGVSLATLASLVLALEIFGDQGVAVLAYCLSASFALALAMILFAMKTTLGRRER